MKSLPRWDISITDMPVPLFGIGWKSGRQRPGRVSDARPILPREKISTAAEYRA